MMSDSKGWQRNYLHKKSVFTRRKEREVNHKARSHEESN